MKTALLLAGAVLALATPAQAVEDNGRAFFSGSDLPRIIETSQSNDIRFNRDFAGKAFGTIGNFRGASENPFWKGHYNVSFGESGRVYCWVSDAETLATIADWHKGRRVVVRGTIKNTTLGNLELTGCRFTSPGQ
jgi:hypothetical protein